MSQKLVNTDNSHTWSGSSNEAFLQGCSGCKDSSKGTGVQYRKGLVGGGTRLTNNGRPLQTVGNKPTASDFYTQATNVGYGYAVGTGTDNLEFAGSGYPTITKTSFVNTCRGGGLRRRKKHKRRRQKRRTRKRLKHRGGSSCFWKKSSRKHPKKGQKSRTRKRKLDFITHLGNKLFNRHGHRQRRPKRKSKKRRPYKKRRKTQRGGSSQSNVPLAYIYSNPNVPLRGTWVNSGKYSTAGQPLKVLNTCQDNYNHYKAKK